MTCHNVFAITVDHSTCWKESGNVLWQCHVRNQPGVHVGPFPPPIVGSSSAKAPRLSLRTRCIALPVTSRCPHCQPARCCHCSYHVAHPLHSLFTASSPSDNCQLCVPLLHPKTSALSFVMACSAIGALAACGPDHMSWSRSSVASSGPKSVAVVANVGSTRGGIKLGGVRVRAGVASSPKTDIMQYRKLGDSDLVISEVTLGTVRIFLSRLPRILWVWFFGHFG